MGRKIHSRPFRNNKGSGGVAGFANSLNKQAKGINNQDLYDWQRLRAATGGLGGGVTEPETVVDLTSFIMLWETTTPDETVTLPLGDTGVYAFTVDWGDGNTDDITTYNDPALAHEYAVAGVYTVKMSGTVPHFSMAYSADSAKLKSVEQWGQTGILSCHKMFQGATNLVINALDVPDFTAATDMSYMFDGCQHLTGNFSDWEVGTITNMSNMFNYALAFNQDISGWDVSKVKLFTSMFSLCIVFNQDLGAWDVGAATSLGSMFNYAIAFNQDLSSWDTTDVTNMEGMFYEAHAFNGDVTTWDVAKVTDFSYMFNYAIAFNQDLSGWVTTAAQKMRAMFKGTVLFNQDLSGWDFSTVTDYTEMFNGAELSVANYDALLISLAGQVVSPNEAFHGGDSQYTGAAAAARASLIADDGWTIIDGGAA